MKWMRNLVANKKGGELSGVSGVMERKIITLNKDLLEKINRAAKENGVSFSELIRLASTYVIDHDIDVYRYERKSKENQEKVIHNLKGKLLDRFGTLAEAARQLDIKYHTLIMYCAGKFKPSNEVVSRILEALG